MPLRRSTNVADFIMCAVFYQVVRLYRYPFCDFSLMEREFHFISFYCTGHARRIVGVGVGRVIVDISIEQPCVSTVVVIATYIREVSIGRVVVRIAIVRPNSCVSV